MKVSYNWLQQKYFDKLLPSPEKLAELLSAHAFEVENIEKLSDDTVFDIKVLPDRAHYALSHAGIALEISAISGISLKVSEGLSFRQSRKESPSDKVKAPEIKVEDEKLCSRYVARRIENVKILESPKWLSARLEAIGARSINTIVDATNYVMFDTGQPLHAFDADKVQGAIVVRKAMIGEVIELLPEKVTVDGKMVFKERSFILNESDIVIADEIGPLVIAGVKGGKRAEVTKETKNLIIESANFNPTLIRKTSGKYNLRNDSSKRFENEITPALASEAMEDVTTLILELSKGAKAGPVTDIYPHPAKSWSVEISPSHMNSVTGLSLREMEMKNILLRLGCKVEEKNGNLIVTPPLERLDLKIPEDIADEIVRIYGYDKLESKQTPKISSVPIDKTFYYAEKIKNILVGLGFSEVETYTLASKGFFEVVYPLASDKSALREKLSPKVLEALTKNTLNAPILGLKDIKIFEIGKVFPKTGEKTSLCIGATGEKFVKDALVALSITNAKIENKIAEINFDEFVAKLRDAENVLELNFVSLSRDIKYKPFSMYPFIVRDIALFVPENTKEEEVAAALRAAAKNAAGDLLIKGPGCFDRFSKAGKTSFAFRLIFQSFDRTLSDDEANSFMQKVYDSVKSKGWEVR